ncbi:MAG: tetratricopeptide repeat protein [Bacteroidota bacterium]|nr:tetratricopeptide repeat protein [Bacteroidota bacterium]
MEHRSLFPDAAQMQALEVCHAAYRLHREGRVTEAIELYRQSIALHPTPEAYTFLGWAYSHLGKYEEAIAECLRAIALDPDYGNPYNDIGVYLMELRQLDEAEAWFEKAIAAPRYATRHYAHYNLGRLYERRGKWIRALHEYYTALMLEPSYHPAALALLHLQAKLN